MWRKITKGILLAVTVLLIIYDIVVVNISPKDTLSDVTMSTLYRFPFIGYAWMVLGGHFFSLIKTKKRYIKPLVLCSVLVLIYSILVATRLIDITGIVLFILAVFGFTVGTFFWSQRRRE